MATFADLSSDIIMAIVSLQRPVNNKVSDWKNTFRILSICRSWRAAMLPVIYANVFIVIPKDGLGSEPPTTRRYPDFYNIPYTNAGLIYENGYGFLVKRMFIRILSKSKVPFPWLRVAEALNIEENKHPEISAVREWMESDTDAEYKIALQNSACINAFGPIAHVLALRFPNVSSLRIKTNEYNSSTQTDVLSKLVSAYASQLVKVDLNDFDINPELLKAANIRYFDKKVLYDFQDAPFINPKTLVCLKLHSDSNKNIWNQFACDKGTKYIEFTNLETLQLTGVKPKDDVPLNIKDWHLKFPKLTHLKIDSGMFANEDFQHTSLNLKTLDYRGSGDIAAKLFENNIVGLEKLHMHLPIYIGDERDTRRFVSQTNTIFSMVGPIPEVSCTGLDAYYLHMPDIYWPNLTRLELLTSVKAYEFLSSIDRIPHLQHLHLIALNSPNGPDYIQVTDDDTDDSDDDGYYRRDGYIILNWSFKELSQLSDLVISGQSLSRLETLSIHWFTSEGYDWHLNYTFLESNVEEDPELIDFLYSDGDSDSDSIGIYGGYCEVPMEDEEADAALRVYFPNLVTTKFVHTTETYYPDVILF